MDDVILGEGPPCFTEQITITVKTLGGKRHKKIKKTNVNQINVTSEMKNKPIKMRIDSQPEASPGSVVCFSLRVVFLRKLWHYTKYVIALLSDSLPQLWMKVHSVCWKVTASPSPCQCFSLSMFLFPSVHSSGGTMGRMRRRVKAFCYSNSCFPLMSPSGSYATDLLNEKLWLKHTAHKILFGFPAGLSNSNPISLFLDPFFSVGVPGVLQREAQRLACIWQNNVNTGFIHVLTKGFPGL